MSHPLTVPVGATAQRPTWSGLPDSVRTIIEDQLGSRVVDASSQGSGYTPGFASRLVLDDGRRVFAKAAYAEYEWMLEAYRHEATKLALLPSAVPAPALRWWFDDLVAGERWVILIMDDIEGRSPHRPWRQAEAELVLDTVSRMSRALTPPPPPPSGQAWVTFAEEFANELGNWDLVAHEGVWREHGAEAAAMTRRAFDLCHGDTLLHCDLRDDNLIIDADGATWVCDWNFPIVGPAWIDQVALLISMSGDGLDADALLERSALVGPDDHEAIDCFLALLIGYFLRSSSQPTVPTSPYLRIHQRWYADAAGSWLASRRGWTIVP